MLNNENKFNIKNLDKGVQIILTAFKEQKEQYLKIINSMKQKINILEEQIKKLKEENILYYNKLTILQKNIKYISKTIYQLKEDDDELIDDKNISYNNNSNNVSETTQQKESIKEKGEQSYKGQCLNKTNMNRNENIIYRNKQMNKNILGNNSDTDNDIKSNMNKNKYLKNKNNKDSKQSFNSAINRNEINNDI